MRCLYVILYISNDTHSKLQTKRIDYKMSTLKTANLRNMTYLTYKRMYDAENGTDYAKRHTHEYIFNKTETDDTTQTTDAQRTMYNDGKQRNIIGNYNDNEIVIEKSFNHLNSLKRALTLSQQTDDEQTKLFHENILMRELFALELTMRTMKTNIKRDNEK